MIRYAMTKHIFEEPTTGMVAHTAASQVLAEVPSMRDWVGMVCEEMWPSAARVGKYLDLDSIDKLTYLPQAVDAMVKWPGSQEPNHTVKSPVLLKGDQLTRLFRGLRSQIIHKTRSLKS